MSNDSKTPSSADLAHLSPEQKRALLAKLLKKKQQAAEQPRRFPLTPAQKRLWFIDQLQPGNTAYNMPVAIRLSGALDPAQLQTCIDEMIARHEILRTVFIDDEGQPWQQAAPRLHLRLGIENLPNDDALTLKRPLDALLNEPFDLAKGPLIRGRLLKISDREHILAIVLHHIIMDFTSLEVMMKDILSLYFGKQQQQANPLAPLKIQYADYANWLDQQRSTLETQQQYWCQQLADAPERLNLPTDFPRPPRQTFEGQRFDFEVDAATYQGLVELARQQQATPFMVMLAAFQLLLFRYSHDSDICVGTTISNRDRAELRDLIGLFVNTLVLRSQLDGQTSFISLLQQLRKTALAAYQHQAIPFENIVDALNIERHVSHNALFQVMFNLHSQQEKAIDLPDLKVSPVAFNHHVARFDLSLDLYDHGVAGDNIKGFFEYNVDLFRASTIERMAGHFQQLLSAIVKNPQQALAALSMFSPKERQQLLPSWAPSPQADTAPRCLQQLIEQQVEATPTRIAVRAGDQTLSYQQLNQQVNQLAHSLIHQGITQGCRVGVCLPSSPAALIAILATVKAGAAYVPMDSSYPAGRLQHMAEDGELSLLITQSDIAPRFAEQTSLALLLVDQEQALLSKQRNSNPPLANQPEDPLYWVYTSGSTGKPKAAGVRHRNELNLLDWYTREYQMNADDRVLIISALGFDLNQKNLFALLTLGGCVVFPTLPHYDPVQLQADIEQQQVTLLNAAPSAFYPLLDQGQTAWPALASLRCVLLGGEPIQKTVLKPWQQASQCTVVNMYGPTECCDIAASYTVPADAWDDEQGFPIGRPSQEVQLLVLAPGTLEPVPQGASGELCIGGAGVGCGYFQKPELNAQAFVDNPFGEGLLYRSGDLVRYRNDGLLTFISRLDSQLKIRGLRIEPREIETLLQNLPQIDNVVVDSWQDPSGEAHLIAYGEHQGEQPSTQTLKDLLADQLPSYMIPAAFVWVAQLPLSANGKLDRKQLPIPELHQTNAQTFEAPSTSTEALLAEIWSHVLNTVTISRHDNFFNIGGHSILAARVIARLQPTFETTVPMMALFEHPVLSDFAQVIDKALDHASDDSMETVHITVQDRQQALPLSYAQQRQWALAELEPDNPFYNMPGAVTLQGPLDIDALQQSFAALAERQEVLRTRILTIDGQPHLDILERADSPLHLVDLSTTPNAQQVLATRLRQAARRPFDLQQAPLLRLHLFKTAEQTHTLLVVLHHIIGDALSNVVLIQELTTLYQRLSQGQAPELPPLTLQYADFAAWQRALNTDQQLSYWQQQLADAPPLLDLACDFHRPPTQQFDGDSVRFTLTPQQVSALRALASRHDATLFMTVLTAFNILLARYSGMDDILIGIPTAHRPHQALEQVIGLFLNTLTLRTRLSEEDSFNSLLKQVRHTAIAAYNHQDIPFEHVLEGLDIPRNWSHNPLFQAMFVWKTHREDEAVEVNGLSWQPRILDDNTAKVDLALIMNDSLDTVSGKLEYRSDLFRRETIEAMTEAFVTLLDHIIAQPEKQALQLGLQAPSHAAKQAQWNQTDSPVSPNALHQLVEVQVAKNPEQIAITDAHGHLSYEALDLRAQNLAGTLQAQGIGRGHRVGILLDRRCDLVAAILAVLKTGAAYVPLDPNYPDDRIAYIAEHAELSAVFTQGDYGQQCQGVPRLCLDDPALNQQHRFSPVDVSPEDLAYIIYTSGSTGKPKGVAITHKSPVSLVHWAVQTFSREQLAGTFAATSICFDLSIFELFVPLSLGTQVILADNLFHLPDHPAKDQVSLINTVPTAAAELLRLEGIPPSVRTVNVAGEAVPAALITALYALPSIEGLYNLYGPSEDTTYSTWTLLDPREAGHDGHSHPISIGHPISNTRVYVLDAHYQALPIGVPGELYLSGDGIAQGYWNQPELTAERFLPNPYNNSEAHGTLYRTGDQVRQRPDGQLEFLGRIDNQVKVRGFRIELSEIDAVLLQHAHITQAATLVHTDPDNGHRQLVAYLVTDLETPEAEQHKQWSEYLKQSLPDYMVPTVFVSLDKLPLLPNGKLNRGALPAINLDLSPKALTTTADFSPLEQQVATVWAQVLKRSPETLEDNFFALGGDSILAIQVVARLREQGLACSPKDIFQYPSVAELASRVGSQALQQVDQSPVIGPVPLLPIQQWFFEQALDHRHHWNQTLLLSSAEALSPKALKEALQAIMTQHDALRARFYQQQGQWQQEILDTDGDIPFVHVEQSVNDLAAFIETYAQSVQQGFSLAQGPLWQVVYFELTTAHGVEHRLLLSAHHLIIDGVSWRILLDDLQSLYRQSLQGLRLTLPPKTSALKHWAQALQGGLDQGVFDSAKAHWQGLAEQAVLPFPTDSDGDNRMVDVASVEVFLNEADTQALISEVPSAYKAHINDLLLAALLLSCEGLTGQRSLRLQMESHGRPDLFESIDLSRSLGWFTALYPVQLDAEANATLEQVLKAVKQQLRSPLHDGIDYGLLRYGALNAPDTAITDCLADCDLRFNYLGQTDLALDEQALLQPAKESTGPAQSLFDQRDVLLDINAMVSQNRLRIQWNYSSKRHHKATIETLAQAYKEHLQALIALCLSGEHDGGLIAADFPQMNLAEDEMDDLLASL